MSVGSVNKIYSKFLSLSVWRLRDYNFNVGSCLAVESLYAESTELPSGHRIMVRTLQ